MMGSIDGGSKMAEYRKPLPIPNEDTKEYWEGAKRHELTIQRCKNCGTYRFPPKALCHNCLSMETEWEKVSGRGKLYTFTIFHQVYGPEWKEEVPYNVAVVELDEGPRMISNIVNCKNEDLRIGMELEVVFEDVTQDITLPKFKPVSS